MTAWSWDARRSGLSPSTLDPAPAQRVMVLQDHVFACCRSQMEGAPSQTEIRRQTSDRRRIQQQRECGTDEL